MFTGSYYSIGCPDQQSEVSHKFSFQESNRNGRVLNGFSQALQNPAGKSESINSYMRLVMNLMKVYSTGETNKDMVRKQS